VQILAYAIITECTLICTILKTFYLPEGRRSDKKYTDMSHMCYVSQLGENKKLSKCLTRK